MNYFKSLMLFFMLCGLVSGFGNNSANAQLQVKNSSLNAVPGLKEFLKKDYGEEAFEGAKFSIKLVDLNENPDGIDEVLLGIEGLFWCGSRGCDYAILQRDTNGRLFRVTGIISFDLVVVPGYSNGMRNLAFSDDPDATLLQFNGEKYISVPGGVANLKTKTAPGSNLQRAFYTGRCQRGENWSGGPFTSSQSETGGKASYGNCSVGNAQFYFVCQPGSEKIKLYIERLVSDVADGTNITIPLSVGRKNFQISGVISYSQLLGGMQPVLEFSRNSALLGALQKGRSGQIWMWRQQIKFHLKGSGKSIDAMLGECPERGQNEKIALTRNNDNKSNTTQFDASQSEDTETVALSTTAVRTVQHEFKRQGIDLGTSQPDGNLDENFLNAVKSWQRSENFPASGKLTTRQLNKLFKIKNIEPSIIGQPKLQSNARAVPFIILNDVTLGGVSEYRRHYEDPALAGITFDQCLKECAADDRCGAVSFIHGCTLMSGYGYRHDNAVNFSDAAVVLFRPANQPENSRYNPAEFVSFLDTVISEYQPKTPVDKTTVIEDSALKSSYLKFDAGELIADGLLSIRKKRVPKYVDRKKMLFGKLELFSGHPKSFFLRDWVVISDQHQAVVDFYNAILSEEKYSSSNKATKRIVPMLQSALLDAEAQLGKNHPALGFLLMDLAYFSSDYTTALEKWVAGQKTKRRLMQRAGQLFSNSHASTTAMQARIAEYKAYALISGQPSQWDKCSADKSTDIKRSNSILSAVQQHIDARGLHPLQIGWIKRATYCLTEDERNMELLNLRYAMASWLGETYARSLTLADLAQAHFSNGNKSKSSDLFKQSFAYFSDIKSKPPYSLNFIYTDYSNSVSADYGRIKLWQSLAELELASELRLALALEFKLILSQGLLNTDEKKYHVAYFTQFLEGANLPDFSERVYKYLDNFQNGSTDPSPVAAMLDIINSEVLSENSEFQVTLLASARKFAKARNNATEQARIASLLAAVLDKKGDLTGASDNARQALLLVKQNNLDTTHYDLANLEQMIIDTQREQGSGLVQLAEKLASDLQKKLTPVCNGEIDLTAFPWLPLDEIIDDPLLEKEFLAQSVVSEYLNCFSNNITKLAYNDWSTGHLSADLLLDVMYVLARAGNKAQAENYLLQLIKDNSWSDSRGYGARLVAISSAINGLVLADLTEWVLPYQDRLLPNLAELMKSTEAKGDRMIRALTRLAYTADTLGNSRLVRQIYETQLAAAAKFAAGKYSNGSSCGTSCQFLYFYENKYGDKIAAEKFQSDYNAVGGLYLTNDTPKAQKQMRDAALDAILHERAGRYSMAELFFTAVHSEMGTVLSDILRTNHPLSHTGFVKLGSAISQIYFKKGNITEARELAQHFVTAARNQTDRATIFGDDPLLRWSKRLKGLFETYVKTGQTLLSMKNASESAGDLEDEFFATQFLQTTNTAATFAKLSSRISSNAGPAIRQYQDMSTRLSAAYDSLVEQSGEEANATTRIIEKLNTQRRALQVKISKENPKALAFGGMQFPKLSEVQGVLKNNEAVLSALVGRDHVYLWLIRNDRYFLHKLNETPKQISELIKEIRLVSDNSRADQPINAELLHRMYTLMFAEFEENLNDVDNLIFIPHKSFDGLPISTLLTLKPSEPMIELSVLRQAKLPWLIRKYVISIMPSVASVVFLKNHDFQNIADKPFLGIGNPNFDGGLNIPTISADAGSDNSQKGVVNYPVNSLPETETELRELGQLLGANMDEDLLLGNLASEENIKEYDFTSYRVIAFATHGLLANELPGTSEPSLLLSTPKNQSDQEDGILFSSEIAELKLNAELVILSACNTAASNGQPGAEGLSGLTNAFFFAGARQLIVTHWQIPSVPAVEISVGMVTHKVDDPNTDWPTALQKSILDVIDTKGPDFYAHPLVWGAHMMVGVPNT